MYLVILLSEWRKLLAFILAFLLSFLSIWTFGQEIDSYGIGRDEFKDDDKMKEKVKERERTQKDYIIQLESLYPWDKVLSGYIFYILNRIYNKL